MFIIFIYLLIVFIHAGEPVTISKKIYDSKKIDFLPHESKYSKCYIHISIATTMIIYIMTDKQKKHLIDKLIYYFY